MSTKHYKSVRYALQQEMQRKSSMRLRELLHDKTLQRRQRTFAYAELLRRGASQ